MSKDKRSRKPPTDGDGKRRAAEWTVFAVSALIVASVAVAIGLRAFGSDVPPAFTTTVQQIEEREGDYYVMVVVENTGDVTAEEVKVDATLHPPGSPPVAADQTVMFLGGHETREVTFVFTEDPRVGRLETGVSSFLVP